MARRGAHGKRVGRRRPTAARIKASADVLLRQANLAWAIGRHDVQNDLETAACLAYRAGRRLQGLAIGPVVTAQPPQLGTLIVPREVAS